MRQSHTTQCAICAAEGFYAYFKTKAGWTPAQIRAGIARHEYESIDLDKAVSSFPHRRAAQSMIQ